MAAPRNPAKIIDHKTVFAELAKIFRAQKPLSPTALRSKTFAVIKPAFDAGRAEIRKRFDKEQSPTALEEYTYLIDQIIIILFQCAGKYVFPARSQRNKDQLTIVATGGYGRGELFPYSDVDVLFLTSKAGKKAANDMSEFILYVLWDLGLTVGQSVQGGEETLAQARSDMTVRTNLLDMRLICGNAALLAALRKGFAALVEESSVLEFVDAKLAERDARHAKCGDSRYVLEPNIKDGKGGLRDLNTLYWLARYVYGVKDVADLVKRKELTAEEYKTFAQARHFLFIVRMYLHYLAGRGEERLTFDRQRDIADALGYRGKDGNQKVERFMKRYFLTAKHVGALTRIFCANLEDEKKRKPRLAIGGLMQRTPMLEGFKVEGERLTVADAKAFTQEPLRMLQLFYFSLMHDLDIHPQALQLMTRNLHRIDRAFLKNDEAGEVFMQIMLAPRNPEITLKRMNEVGLLGKFIPDFGRVVGQMQFDMYHTYTVDEHTLFAIGILHHIEKGKFKEEMPLASEIVHKIESRRVLYLALFCHDIAKGRGGNHSEIGEKIVRAMAERFGFSAHEADTAAWLVRHHLLMSDTAFKRDIHDPATIRTFMEAVQSPERLKLLLVLTVADIRAVGPTIWNGWKAALLRDLYYKGESMMGASDSAMAPQQQHALQEGLREHMPAWSDEEIQAYLMLGVPAFWSSYDVLTHARIAAMHRLVAEQRLPFALDVTHDTFRAVTEISLCAPDQHGLFSKVAGVMALAGANIVGSKIFTLKDGTAIETFRVQNAEGKAFSAADKLKRLEQMLGKALAGEIDLAREINKTRLTYPSRYDAFDDEGSVFIDNSISTTSTVIEINGRDRIGFLYRITKALADQALSIVTAHIATYGERVVDVFYVKDIFGMKLLHDNKQKQVRDALQAALHPVKEKKETAS